MSGKVGLVPGNYLDIIEPLNDEEQSSEETVCVYSCYEQMMHCTVG